MTNTPGYDHKHDLNCTCNDKLWDAPTNAQLAERVDGLEHQLQGLRELLSDRFALHLDQAQKLQQELEQMRESLRTLSARVDRLEMVDVKEKLTSYQAIQEPSNPSQEP